MIYLDHAATTPLAPEVLAAMLPYFEHDYGNPSSTHRAGRIAREGVERSREQVAAAVGVDPLDVLFTSGGTEADNQAVKGIAWAAREAGRGAHVVTTAIEHHAVLDAVTWLRDAQGFTVTIVPVGRDGVVDPQQLLDCVTDETVLVTVMAANNEVGTVQPLDVIGPELAERGVCLHTDAVQAFGRTPLPLDDWHIGAASLSAHKFNGPKGVGVLVLRRDVPAVPVLHGGGQERGVRSGTFNTPGIVGCGAAAELTAAGADNEIERLRSLRDTLITGLCAIDGVDLNGSPTARLPHNAHIAVEGCDGDALMTALDSAGVCASTGSACQSGAAAPSHVLAAVGAAADCAHVRLTCGRSTTAADAESAVERIDGAIAKLRAAGGGFFF